MKDGLEDLDENRIPIVWIPDEETTGVVRSYGVYVSTVEFEKDGFRQTVLMDNDDFIIIDFLVFNYEGEE